MGTDRAVHMSDSAPDEMIPVVCAYHNNLISRFNRQYLFYWCKECKAQHYIKITDITEFTYGTAKELKAKNTIFLRK